MARDVFLCDAVRTPIGRYAGALAKVRADDLAAIPIKALVARNPKINWEKLDEVYYGCANQAGEDNRNVARMALLLAGLPTSVPGVTLNRLCASGLDAVGSAARAIRAGEIDFAIAGGVESMTRAPFVQGKASEAFARTAEIYDTTIGWRFVNPLMKQQYGVDSMPETARTSPRNSRLHARIRTLLRCARSKEPARLSLQDISPKKSSRSKCREAKLVRSRSTRMSIPAPTRRSNSWRSSRRRFALREP